VDNVEIGGMNGSLGRLGTPKTTNQNDYDNWCYGRMERSVFALAILRTNNRRLSHVQSGVRGRWEKMSGVKPEGEI